MAKRNSDLNRFIFDFFCEKRKNSRNYWRYLELGHWHIGDIHLGDGRIERCNVAKIHIAVLFYRIWRITERRYPASAIAPSASNQASSAASTSFAIAPNRVCANVTSPLRFSE